MAHMPGEVPAVFPPHPPLVSGPGRYPMESKADRFVGAALAVSAVLGPVGLCFVSVAAGLVAASLTLVAATVGARLRHRRHDRQ
jgi:hypothetical protein